MIRPGGFVVLKCEFFTLHEFIQQNVCRMPRPGHQLFSTAGLFFFILFLPVFPAIAAFSDADEPPAREVDEADENGMVRMADAGQYYLSEKLHDFADWVDNFLGNERMDIESRGSRIRLNTGLLLEEGSSTSYQFNVNVNLSLPRTSDRLKLLFEGDSEDIAAGQDPDGETLRETIRDIDYTAALRYIFKATRVLYINADLGVRFSIPVDPFVRLRIRRAFFISDWELRAEVGARWFVEAGLEAGAQLEMDTSVAGEDLFRSTSRARWDELSNVWEFGQFFSLFDYIDSRQGLTLTTGLIVRTNVDGGSASITEYLINSSYRRDLYKGWLFFEFRPEFRFPRERDYDFTPSVLFLVEVILGRTQLN